MKFDRKHRPVLVISPSTRGGSWRWIQEVTGGIRLENQLYVVAYGRKDEIGANWRAGILVPFISYEKVGLWMHRHPAVVPFYNLPLVFVAYLAMMRWRPRAIVANGLFLALACTPYSLIANVKILLAFHGYVGRH